MKIEAGKFSNRKDIEDHIKKEVGLNITQNEAGEHSIEGTRAELKKLSLSDRNKIYGVKCIITDTPTQMKKTAKDIAELRKPIRVKKTKKKK